jgi:dTMP kinase
MASLTELFLFATSRAQVVAEVIRPSLEQGAVVICDRYTDSTTAYQGYGRGIDLRVIETINTIATQGLRPDLIILLDIPIEQGLERKKSLKRDRFEQEEIAFHHRVREGYLKMAADDPQRWLVVNAAQPKKQVEKIIWERVDELLPKGKT